MGEKKKQIQRIPMPFPKATLTHFFGLTKYASTPIYMQIHRYVIGSVWGRSRVDVILHCGVGIIQNV